MAISRRTLARGNIALALGAALALFALVNYLALRHYTQWDWTAGRLYSLSGQTESVLGKLSQNVRIVSFLTEGPQAGADALEQIRTLLAAYQARNTGKIQVEYLDPLRDPVRARALLEEFSIDPRSDSIDVVVVESGSRRKQVRLDEMVEFDAGSPMGGPPPVKSITAEQALTSAIVGVTRSRKPTVRFAGGHGERDFRAADESGLSRLVEALKRQDIDVEAWDALGSNAVPEGTDLVVVAAPAQAWLGAERDALARYLEQGGRAFLLLEPQFQRGAGGKLVPSGLEPLLEAWGVAANDDIVIDTERGLPFFGPETFYAQPVGGHPVTSSLAGQPVLIELARSLAPAQPPPQGLATATLIDTSGSAWGETALDRLQEGVAPDDSDHKGPLTLAYAAARSAAASAKGDGAPAPANEPAGRVVVTGDVDMASNAVLDQLGNRGFVLNGISWLMEEERSLGIPPKDRMLSRLFLSVEQVRWLFVLTSLALPLAAVAVGLGVWWRRRG
ncbi:MAG: GldG family protein [Acidobacteria bacterium]|nr:GldG family protein [Acidobacteriota bacterium]